MAGRRIGGIDPATGRPGGSEPAKRKRTGTVVTVTVAVTIGLGGASLEGTASVSRSSTTSGKTSSSSERSSLEISTEDFQSAEIRLARRGLRVNGHFQSDGATCVEHAYGEVREFFRHRPCAALHRAQFQIGDKQGDVILVAVSWVQMPNVNDAIAYKHLVDAYGTGNVTELSRESGRYRTVRYTGIRYKSSIDGAVVANAQAEPVTRGAAGIALATIITHTVL